MLPTPLVTSTNTGYRSRGWAPALLCLAWSLSTLGTLSMISGCSGVPNSGHMTQSDAADSFGDNGKNLNSGALRHARPEQVLGRISWGITPASVAQIRKLGTAAFIESQLRPGPENLPPEIQAQISAMTISQKGMDELIIELEQRRINADAAANPESARQSYQQELNRLAKEAASRAILRALYSPLQLQEQLSWFWLNHFSVFQGKNELRAMVGDYEEHAIRPHVVGRFRDLLAATATHPAMLVYLDNAQNAVKRPNENYAREIMELHTMGVDGGYTQHDIVELARILTGFGINKNRDAKPLFGKEQSQAIRRGLFEFNPRRHDYGDKQFLGKTIKGRGAAELDEALDLLAHHPSTAHFVSKKLAIFYVGDNPPEALINRMAQTYLASDGNITSVLRTLFASDEFAHALGTQFKDPQQYVFSALRLAYDTQPILNTTPVLYWLSRLGETRYGKLTPDGYPLTSPAWNSPGQMTTRFEIARTIANGSQGLFKTDTGVEKAAFPKLSNALYFDYLQGTLSKNTLHSLEQAGNPQEWNTLFLAAPEMMQR